MTLFKLVEILRRWPAFLAATEPHLATAIRERWPSPPSLDEALATIGGPPGSQAAAAFAQALAAIDDDSGIDDGGEEKTGIAAIAPSTGAERPLEGEIIPPRAVKRESKKAKSRAVMERRGRPSTRAQKLVCEQLANGPKPGSAVMAAAYLADISEQSLIAAADALGVRVQRGQWWLPR
jgi:hypothetical protein